MTLSPRCTPVLWWGIALRPKRCRSGRAAVGLALWMGMIAAQGVSASPEYMNAPGDPLAGYQPRTLPAPEGGVASHGLSLMFEIYQHYIGGNRGYGCPMEPSCSEYARRALSRFGLWRGTALAADRLLRCGADLQYYPLTMSDRGPTHDDPVPR